MEGRWERRARQILVAVCAQDAVVRSVVSGGRAQFQGHAKGWTHSAYFGCVRDQKPTHMLADFGSVVDSDRRNGSVVT